MVIETADAAVASFTAPVFVSEDDSLLQFEVLVDDGRGAVAAAVVSLVVAPAAGPVIPGDVTPFVCGVLRPAVVLPSELAHGMQQDELRAVLAHECAHVRRRDPLLGWLLALCQAGYWFHPGLHLARRRLMREREAACDDCVLALGQASQGLYANALIAARMRASSSSKTW